MQKDTSHFVVRLTDDNFGSKTKRKYITGTGDTLSDIAFALGYTTFEDCISYNDTYLQSIVESEIDAYDWGGYARQELDNEPECIALAQGQDEFLPGDYYDINHHDNFLADVKKRRSQIVESIFGVFPFNRDAEAPKVLLKRISDAVDSAYDSLREEWKTDIRHAIAERFDIPGTSVQEDSGIVIFDFTEEQARDYLGYFIQDDEPVTAEALQAHVINTLLVEAENIISAKERRYKERLEAKNKIYAEIDHMLEEKKARARQRKAASQ